MNQMENTIFENMQLVSFEQRKLVCSCSVHYVALDGECNE